MDTKDIERVLERITCASFQEEAKKHILNCPLCQLKIKKEIGPWLGLAKVFGRRD